MVFPFAPNLRRQQAPLVAIDLRESINVVPLPHNQVRLEQEPAIIDKHFIERLFVGDLQTARSISRRSGVDSAGACQ